MGVPNVKVTMFFVSGTVGWDESHFYIPLVDLGDMGLLGDVTNLMLARVQCLDGVAAKLTDVRMSIDNVNRDTQHVPRDQIPVPDDVDGYLAFGGPSAGSNAWVYQTPQVAWPILFDTSATVVDSEVYITGMPANWKQSGPGPFDLSSGTGATTYLTAYGKYLTTPGKWGALSGRSWPFATITAGNSTAITAPPVWAGPTAGGPATLTITAAAPPVPVAFVGGYVRLGGLKWTNHFSRRRFNHTYQVLKVAGLVITLAAGDLPYDPAFISNGYFQTSAQAVYNYTAFSLRNLTHKKRGRPTYSPRGRRAA